jgi:HD-like signal output (HDOD) protein/CheY-like chemotaxis protein
MLKIGLITIQKKEAVIIKSVLEQRNIELRLLSTSASSYRQMMQIKPDLLIMEISEKALDQLHTLSLIRENKQIKNIPVICYGNSPDKATLTKLIKLHVNRFFLRPLKLAALFSAIAEALKDHPQLTSADLTISDAGQQPESDEIALIRNPEKPKSEKLRIMASHVGKLMAFPFSMMKIVAITNDKSSGAAELSQAIKADSAIATDILRIANSVLFASRDRKTTDIREAVVRIGFEETKKITLSLKVMQMANPKTGKLGFNRDDFWMHSLGTALIAEKLAKVARLKNPSMAFLGGLLHNLGLLILDEFFEALFLEVLEVLQTESIPVTIAEKRVLGLHHNELVELLFEKWSMPPEIGAILKLQEHFRELPSNLPPEFLQLACCVGLGSLLAKCANLGKPADSFVESVPPEVFALLNMPRGVQNSFFDSIYQGIHLFTHSLNMKHKTFPLTPVLKLEGESPRILVLRDRSELFVPHAFFMEHVFSEVKFCSPAEVSNVVDDFKPHLLVITLAGNVDATAASQFIQGAVRGNPITGILPPPPALVFYQNKTEVQEDNLPKAFTKFLPRTLDLQTIVALAEELLQDTKDLALTA